MKPRTLDVSHLPNTAWDEASPLWWGNLLLTFIETTTLAIMLATYFYLRMNAVSYTHLTLPTILRV